MKQNASYIRNRLSLRKPQEDSLYILSELADKLELKKFSQRKHDEITKKSCMEVVDFDNRRIEQYNLSEIFKPV